MTDPTHQATISAAEVLNLLAPALAQPAQKGGVA